MIENGGLVTKSDISKPEPARSIARDPLGSLVSRGSLRAVEAPAKKQETVKKRVQLGGFTSRADIRKGEVLAPNIADVLPKPKKMPLQATPMDAAAISASLSAAN